MIGYQTIFNHRMGNGEADLSQLLFVQIEYLSTQKYPGKYLHETPLHCVESGWKLSQTNQTKFGFDQYPTVNRC